MSTASSPKDKAEGILAAGDETTATAEKLQRGGEEEVVFVELPAPSGWKKKFIPKSTGTPRKNEIVFVSPSGEEMRNKRQLDHYLKSHQGGPSSSEFDWGTGDTPRRSARISERVKAMEIPEEEPPKKRGRRSSSKKGSAEKKDGKEEAPKDPLGQKQDADVEMKDVEDSMIQEPEEKAAEKAKGNEEEIKGTSIGGDGKSADVSQVAPPVVKGENNINATEKEKIQEDVIEEAEVVKMEQDKPLEDVKDEDSAEVKTVGKEPAEEREEQNKEVHEETDKGAGQPSEQSEKVEQTAKGAAEPSPPEIPPPASVTGPDGEVATHNGSHEGGHEDVATVDAPSEDTIDPEPKDGDAKDVELKDTHVVDAPPQPKASPIQC